MARFPVRSGVLLAMLPLVFTGKAFLRGELYGPADLYYQHYPWKTVAAENAVGRIENPILSDLAFANLPWRAAVREALVNGRLPFWNRFVLGGNPLLGTAQAAAFHPSTWLGIFLPLALSWTFSCAFTIFLALLAAYVFFREICRTNLAALVGAIGWGFSTFVLFWDGWAVGPSIAAFPLLLLGLRRLARGGEHPIAVTAAALLLSALGGHPETLFHSVAAAGVYFLWELFARDARPKAGRALGGALAAGLLAASLAAPALLPLLEALPHSAEYAARRAALARGRGGQSVPAIEAARRLRPAVLPFVHGIYGKSPVQDRRQDGSGMPLAYAGAVLFPLAAVGLGRRKRPPHPDPPAARFAGNATFGRGRNYLSARGDPSRSPAEGEGDDRERRIFGLLLIAGLLYGASAPLLLDATARLPGFALALNYRLVFLAPFGLAGLAALGTDRVGESPGSLAVGATAVVSVLMLAYLLAVPVMRDRDLTATFTRQAILFEGAPVILLILAALVLPRRIAAAALVLLVGQRFFEMRGTYPTLPGRALAPRLPTFSALPKTVDPYRIVAAGETFRPNAAALYGLEDVRGYESLVLDRFAETYSLWCRPQHASFNRVSDLTAPFLSFLNARYAIGEPDASEPAGWRTVARGVEGAVFENPKALPRAFVPRRLRVQPDAKRRVAEMGSAESFEENSWLVQPPHPDPLPEGEGVNGHARVTVREVGTDLIVEADVRDRALVATSLPDWPGWRARAGGQAVELVTVNHAFVGFWLPPGRHAVRLHYLPGSFLLGLVLSGASIVAVLAAAFLHRRRGIA